MTTPDRPVRPRDAASLVIVREGAKEPEILLGKRHVNASFIPDAFVFPGGKLDKEDAQVAPARPLSERTREITARHGLNEAKARTLANTAIRETWEETGLILGAQGAIDHHAPESWEVFREQALAPDHQPLDFIVRAITPTNSPIRFHARFFLTRSEEVQGELGGSGELAELDWYPVSEALKLPIIDVTEFVLKETEARLRKKHHAPETAAIYTYRNDSPFVRYK